MARPYAQLSIEDLEDLLNKHGRDQPILSLLIEELARRHTKRARKLLSIVAELVAKPNSSEAEGETQSQRELELDDGEPNPSPEIITEGSAYSRGGEHRDDVGCAIGAEDCLRTTAGARRPWLVFGLLGHQDCQRPGFVL